MQLVIMITALAVLSIEPRLSEGLALYPIQTWLMKIQKEADYSIRALAMPTYHDGVKQEAASPPGWYYVGSTHPARTTRLDHYQKKLQELSNWLYKPLRRM